MVVLVNTLLVMQVLEVVVELVLLVGMGCHRLLEEMVVQVLHHQ